MTEKSRMFHLDRPRPIVTWNPVIGCEHHCYNGKCWAAQLANGRLKYTERYKDGFDHPKLVAKELKKRFHGDKVVFVTSMGDLFGRWVPTWWISRVLDAEWKSDKSVVFFHETKNPSRYSEVITWFKPNTILSATIETNRDYSLTRAPVPLLRYTTMMRLNWPHKHVSIEPIMDFDFEVLYRWMKRIDPEIVSVGYDNYNLGLPEPPIDKTYELISQLEQFTKVEKKNLEREA